jgi:Rod binding domain-containing protein
MSAPGSESVGASLAAAQLTEPAWVRNGSAQVQREYALGLEFERLLVQQLATSMTETAEPSGEGEEGGQSSSGGATSVLSSMLPGALAQGVVNGGGLGLAAELTRGLEGTTGGATTAPSGATTAPSGGATAAPSGGVEADLTGGARA